jgi:hypothetical protein
VEYLETLWSNFNENIEQVVALDIGGMPTLLNTPSCINASRKVAGSMNVVENQLDYLFDELKLYGYTNVSGNMAEDWKIFQQISANLSKCLMTYSQDLSDLNTWLDTASDSLSSAIDEIDLSPTAHFVNVVANLFATLVESYNKYSDGSMTKEQLVRVIQENNQVSYSLDDLYSSVFTVLDSAVDAQQKSIQSAYVTLLEKTATLQGYMATTDQTIHSFLRGLKIWRRPVVDMQNPQVRH